MFDTNRYSVNYIHQCLMKADIEPPSPERAGENIDALKALYEAHKQAGVDGAKQAWQVLRRAVPHLDQKQKLINFQDLHLIERPTYALPMSENGEAPPYAIYLKGLNVIYGQPGGGKTFVALDFAKRLALAYPNNGVIFAAGEGDSGLDGRSRAWDKQFKASPENMYLWREAPPLLNLEAVEEFVSFIQPLKPIFVVIDTLARAMAGENENDTSIMSKFISATENLMHRLQSGFLLIHHTGRSGFIRGSSVLDGSCDSMLKLVATDTTVTVYNSLEHGGKNKHNPEINSIRLNILPVEVEVDGLLYSEAVVVPSDKIIDDVIETLTDNQRIIIEFVFDVGEPVTAPQIIDSVDIHRATIFRNLSKLVSSEFLTKDETTGKYALTEKGSKSLGL